MKNIILFLILLSTTFHTKATIVKTIGASGDYVSITAAWAAIPGIENPITQPWIFEIQSDYSTASETFPINLTARNGASATNTITIRPQLGVTALTISTNSALSVFKFNGADFVIIDGRPGGIGASDFTIENTQTATSNHAVHLTADATFNTIKYCTIKGSSYATTSVQNASVIGIDEGSASTNCDNTIISNCTITKSGTNKPACLIGISRISTFTALNNMVINNNSFSDFDIAAIYSPVEVASISITDNSFYQTTTWGNLAITSYGIYLVNTSNSNISITGNYIGGQASNCTGSPMAIISNTSNVWFTAIRISSYSSTPTISLNTIQNINFTQSTNANSIYGFIGMEISGTSNYTIGSNTNSNIIGSTTGIGSITISGAVQANFLGILYSGTGTSTSIAYNTIGGITMTALSGTLTGISITGTSTTTIDNNTIGNTTINNISSSANASNFMIYITSNGTHSVTNNLIQQILLTGGASSTIFSGIYLNSNAVFTVTGNTICTITSNGTSGASYANNGIFISSTASCSVNSNTIGSPSANNISFSGNSATTGILFNSTGTYTCNNNTIQQFNLTGGSTSTSFHGIYLLTNGTLTASGNMICNITCNGTSVGGHFGIRFRSTLSGSAISNTIGNSTSNNMTFTGNTNMNAISFNANGVYTCTNNTIQQFNLTNIGIQTTFRGIYMTSGTLSASGNVFKNITCSGTGNGATSTCGIYISSSNGNHNCSSNILQDFITAGQTMGIYLSTTSICMINSNTFGSSTSNNMIFSYNGPSYGLYATGGLSLTCNSNIFQNYNLISTGTGNSFTAIYLVTGTASITANTVNNLISASKKTTVSGGQLAINGIYIATGGNTISNNNLSTFTLNSNTAGSYSISGIYCNTPSGTNTLTKNKIIDLGSAGTSAATLVVGLFFEGAGNVFGSNNIILINNGPSAGNSIQLEGIKNNASGTISLYHNTIKIYGTTTGNSGSSSAYRNGIANTINLRNNIFQNCRTNSGGTGKHYAINYSTNPSTVNAENYNYVEASGLGGNIGFLTSDQNSLSNWQTASGTGADNTSGTIGLSSTGQVTNCSGSIETYLNGIDLYSSSIVTDDYANSPRPTSPCRGAFECIIPLPVDQLFFSAKYIQNDTKVVLMWTTASEQNNDYYTIERTIDGVHFENIGSIGGGGNSTSLLNYTIFDNNPIEGISYYRLKQTDYDGNTIYSELESILIESDQTINISIYPNPSKIDDLEISIHLKEMENVKIELINEIGNLIASEFIENIDNLIYSPKEKIADYKGLIFCKITYNNKQCISKIIIE